MDIILKTDDSYVPVVPDNGTQPETVENVGVTPSTDDLPRRVSPARPPSE